MSKTILFLQSEVHSYHLHLIRYLISHYQYSIIVIYWDVNRKTPYLPPEIEGANFIGKSTFNDVNDIISYLSKIDITLMRVSGWMDRDYVKVSRHFKRKLNVPSVVCSDTQWKNTIRQNIGRLLFSSYLRGSFSKMMVAGPYQYEYARKLGFSKRNILFSNLSADSNIFRKAPEKIGNSKTLLYVGRLSEEKGVMELIEAWNGIKDKRGYTLKLVGSGPLLENFSSNENLDITGFVPNEEIPQLMQNASFFVLPSNSEQWGVVMHEATLSGLPIICSDQVGAIPYFLIDGYNGYIFKARSITNLRSKIEKVLLLKPEEIDEMKQNSFSLGGKITTEITCASLLSVLND